MLLYDLLREVVRWAEENNVRVEDAAWKRAQRVLADGLNPPEVLPLVGKAFVQLFAGFQTPALVLMGRCTASWPAASRLLCWRWRVRSWLLC